MVFFFYKQKAAYEMRISDWSSDVCSSDLQHDVVTARLQLEAAPGGNFDRTRGSHFHNGAVLDGFVHLDHSRYGARQAGQRHGMIAGVNHSNEGGWWSGGAN